MNKTELILYKTQDSDITIDVLVENETIWLTQKQIANLFGTEHPAISKHISNIYKSGELDKNSTVSILEIVQQEGKRTIYRNVSHYNLDMILSVGYRVKSKRGTEFRIWVKLVVNLINKNN